MTTGKLMDVTLTPHYNGLAQVGQAIAAGSEISDACQMHPGFHPDIQFYIVRCAHTVTSVDLVLDGDGLHKDGRPLSAGPYPVQQPHSEDPVVVKLDSCEGSNCVPVTFDVFRMADETPRLEMLGLSAKPGMQLDPAFNPLVLHYKASIPLHTEFSISAAGQGLHTMVGIEATGPGTSGLGEDTNGCEKAGDGHMVWKIPGADSSGELTYTVCAVRSQGMAMTKYNVVVSREVLYSADLKSLEADGFELDPPFSPDHQSYQIKIPPTVRSVSFKAVSKDSHASIRFWANDASSTKNGTHEENVKMKDNSDVHDQAPKWTETAEINVISADGRTLKTYMVAVQQVVSKYCDLKGLKVDLLPLEYGHGAGIKSCDLKPEFNPNTTQYHCSFWWSPESKPRIIPLFDEEKCQGCSVAQPDPSAHSSHHLSLFFEKQEPSFWAGGRPLKDWHAHERRVTWTREFLYGEFHSVPITVRSEDKYTHKIYHVHLERTCPWYMKASFTRALSTFAANAAVAMAVTSAPNIMNLAKQIQFMSLTADIPDAPKSYVDFTSNLQTFNLNIGPAIPMPSYFSKKTIEKKIKNLFVQLQKNLGIPHAKLYCEYCFALDELPAPDGEIVANYILDEHCSHSVTLVGELSNISIKDPHCQGVVGDRRLGTPSLANRSLAAIGQLADPLTLVGEGRRAITNAQLRGTLRQLRDNLRQLGDEEDEKDTDDEEENAEDELSEEDEERAKRMQEGPWMWHSSDWDYMLEKAHDRGIKEDSYPLLTCEGKELQEAIVLLKTMNGFLKFRRLVHSTTGSFLIMITGLFSIGILYALWYFSMMRGNQYRLQVLEPGPLWIFLLDYGLITFSAHASAMLFHDPDIQLFVWEPSRSQEVGFCYAVLCYPVIFLIFITCKIKTLTSENTNPSEAEHGLIWNPKLGAWVDPTCRDMLVILESVIPKQIPLLPAILTKQVRSCLPVHNEDGNPIALGRSDNKAKEKEEEKNERQHQQDEAKKKEEQLARALAKRIASMPEEDPDPKKREKRKNLELELKRVSDFAEYKSKVAMAVKTNLQRAMGGAKEVDFDTISWFKAWKGEKEDSTKLPKLGEVADKAQSVKLRDDKERLDKEESFAIEQFIKHHIREERRLLKYGILRIIPKDSLLQPQEPMKKSTDFEKLCLDRSEQYTDEEGVEDDLICQFSSGFVRSDLDGAGKEEQEFTGDGKEEQEFIQDKSGRRLVYEGDTKLPWYLRLLSMIIRVPGAGGGGRLKWKSEPDEGWSTWEAKKTMRYADKWQWLAYDRWDNPWFGDDASEKEKRICCCTVSTSSIPFYNDMQKWALKQARGRVASKIRSDERLEMRQWLFNELLTHMNLKLRIGFLADQHPKFHRGWTLEQIAWMDFGEMLHTIQASTLSEDAATFYDSRARHDMHEHRDYTMMKLEDTYPMDDEPWWQDCDPANEGEMKVMFDTETFWKEAPEDVKKLRQENDLIPKHGYFSSQAFTTNPNTDLGVKRYQLTKPDGSSSEVHMSVKLTHVLPFMRYTNGFKVNVPFTYLEMPNRTQFNIVIGKSKEGEQYSYVIDRLTTFVSILVLADKTFAGWIPASVFMCLKILTWMNQYFVSWQSASKSEAPLRERMFQVFFLQDVLVLFMQAATLMAICLSFGVFPPELCALACIVITSSTMLVMNLGTAKKEVLRVAGSISDTIRQVNVFRRTAYRSARKFLDGQNPLGIQIIPAGVEEKEDVYKPKDVEMVIPELGVHIHGQVKIDDLVPEDEKAEMELVKTVATWTHVSDPTDKYLRISNVTDHARFEKDIAPSLCLALDVNQVLLRRKIPDIMVCLQCVNHSSTRISCPAYDTYKTLFRPEDWDEAEHDEHEVTVQLEGWKKEIEQWITDELGGVTSQRTDTKDIQNHVDELLKKQLLSKNSRQIVKLNVGTVRFPLTGDWKAPDLDGKLAQVVTLFNTEVIAGSFPTERFTKFGVIRKIDKSDGSGDKEYACEINDTLVLEKRPGQTKIRFVVWANVDDTHQELICFSSPIDMTKIQIDASKRPQVEIGLQASTASTNQLMLPSDSVMRTGSSIVRENSGRSNRSGGASPRSPKKLAKMKSIGLQKFDSARKFFANRTKSLLTTQSEAPISRNETVDVKLHTKFTSKAAGVLAPYGGEDIDPEEERRLKEHQQAMEDLMTPWQQRMARWRKNLWWAVTLKHFFPDPTEKQKEATRGEIEINLFECDADEQNHDTHLMETLQDVLKGSSTLSLDKMQRHKDRWLLLAELLRIPLSEAWLGGPQNRKHQLDEDLEEVERVSKKWSADENERKEQEAKFWKKKIDDRQYRRTLNTTALVTQARDELAQKLDVYKHEFEADMQVLEKAGKTETELPRPGLVKQVHGRTVMDLRDQAISEETLADMDDGEQNTDKNELQFGHALLEKLTVIREKQARYKKQILHYVIVSDHLKPGRNWRPDAIPAHDAQILTNEFQDVQHVRFSSSAVDVTFHREKTGKEPKLVNGRLAFKAISRDVKKKRPQLPPESDAEKIAARRISALFEAPVVYMYWDGHGKWIIAASPDQHCPYEVKKGSKENFLFVIDPAVSPDKVHRTWKCCPDPESTDRAWVQATEVRILPYAEGDGRHALLGAGGQDEEEDDSETPALIKAAFDIFHGFFAEVASLFIRSDGALLPPELKPCMLSLSSSHVTFLWKDVFIEKLRPFRKLLLDKYGSYEGAWQMLTTKIKIDTRKATHNLREMLEKTHKNIEQFGGPTDPEDVPAPTQEGLSAPSRSMTMGAMGSLLSSVNSQQSLQPPSREQTERNAGGALRPLLQQWENRLDKLADEIMSLLDKDGEGFIDQGELMVLYNEEYVPEDGLLKEFQKWLHNHPTFSVFHAMWAEISEGRDIDKKEFLDAVNEIPDLMLQLLWEKDTSGASTQAGAEHVDDDPAPTGRQFLSGKEDMLAAKIFQDLDVQLSGGISLNELKPVQSKHNSGDESLLQFKLPLTQIWEMRTEAHKKTKAIRFFVNPQFVTGNEWKSLKRALNPDWEPDPEVESVKVQMSENYYKLWRIVIDNANMDRPQEFVKHYRGAYQEHPHLHGWYMRHGYGEQTWRTKQVYNGHWMNHVYHGEGDLWSSVEDYNSQEADATPLYKGQWYLGQRNGNGQLVWAQETYDRMTAVAGRLPGGVTKVYQGQFKDDLFSGKGKLYVAEVVCQNLPKRRWMRNSEQRFVPVPSLEVSQLRSFEGQFESDWKAAHDKALGGDPQYATTASLITPEERHLQLNLVKNEHYRDGDARYTNYFDQDQNQIQKSGLPMPDLALATYGLFRGEAQHLKYADKAKYIDGSVYRGFYENGLPNGKGTLWQYDEGQGKDASKEGDEIAMYDGHWQDANRHGHGTYKTCDELEYVGQWAQNRRHGTGKQTVPEKLQTELGYQWYDGTWKEDIRVGHGKMLLPSPASTSPAYVYDGPFMDNCRQGKGKVYCDDALVYHGWFDQDIMVANTHKPAWINCAESSKEEGSWYYGTTGPDGRRHGRGTLYSIEAAKDEEFMKCVNEGRKYEDRPVERNLERHKDRKAMQLKFTIYSGTWQNNLPHGKGTQHLTGLGTYEGQFAEGKRHGCGVWETLDGAWKWMPSQTEGLKKQQLVNWKDDLMHGVGRIEDLETIHDDVVFEDGKCQMPFTDLGPPKTGFYNTPIIGNLIDATDKAVHGSRADGSAPRLSFKDSKGNNKAPQKRADGWSEKEAEVYAGVAHSMEGLGHAEPNPAGVEEETFPGFVRENTFVCAPVEDLYVTGGTGDNSAINGLYVKLQSTYGHPVWRLSKKETSGLMNRTKNVLRFIHRDGQITNPNWVISSQPNKGITVEAGAAFASAKLAESPGQVTTPWTVYNPSTKLMMEPLSEQAEKDKDEELAKKSRFGFKPPGRKKIDRIRVHTILGFEVAGYLGAPANGGHAACGPQACIMIRQETVYYGRPVYFAESGGQYLYWVKQDAEDLEKNGDADGRTLKMGSTLYEQANTQDDTEENALPNLDAPGAWVIGTEVGQRAASMGCLAYCEDSAATPKDIPDGKKWNVRVKRAGTKKASDEFSVTNLLLRMKVFSRTEDTMKMFETQAITDGSVHGPTPTADHNGGTPASSAADSSHPLLAN